MNGLRQGFMFDGANFPSVFCQAGAGTGSPNVNRSKNAMILVAASEDFHGVIFLKGNESIFSPVSHGRLLIIVILHENSAVFYRCVSSRLHLHNIVGMCGRSIPWIATGAEAAWMC